MVRRREICRSFVVTGRYGIEKFAVLCVAFMDDGRHEMPVLHRQPETLFICKGARLPEKPGENQVVCCVLHSVVEFSQQSKRRLGRLRCLRTRLPDLFVEPVSPIEERAEFVDQR